MADATVGVLQPPSPDRLIDNESLTVGANTVYRQRTRITGGAAAELARVANVQPISTDYGLTTRDVNLDITLSTLNSSVTPISQRYSNMSGVSTTLNTLGDNTVHTPAASKTIRLKWVGFSSPDSNSASFVVTVKLGTIVIYTWAMSKNGGAFAHGTVRTDGGVNGALVVSLSAAQTLYFNAEFEEF